jgi:class 3 adenylate cyclase/predicted ATPase
MLRCPSCGQENPEGFRFCGACATPLGPEVAERREERKVVTVLFCDLVGSTAQAERLDPEDVRALLSRYHKRVRAELELFGGTVEKFIGDAVMALFGAPVAHEDDPERAVRAALAVREWAGEEPDVQVRVGITTGETLVALGTRPDLGEGMAAGDVVNTAARLQAAAPVDGILVDETTFRATERVVEYAAAQPVEAKGKEAPVAVWEAVQARSRFGVDVRQIGATPLLGRDRERMVLTEALARVKEERSPQLVTLVGVPGIGKSRLVWELFRHIEAGKELVTWRQGRSLPYGEGVAFWALGEIVKEQAGILETDAEADAAAKLERTVRTLVTDDRDAAWVERHLRPLVGLESGADTRGDRGEAFAAWRRFLESLGEQRPLVLVFEDLHFANDGLLDFVDHFADWATGVPVLIVGTARPELLARRPSWGGGKPNSVTISLSPLSGDETARLVRTLLDRSVLDAALQQTLLDRAGGNPLYAEEFARLVATGREPAELPETVQGIVAARLDLLPIDEKRLLHDASVVGKVFWLGALASMDGTERQTLERHLHALERKEFLRRERRPSVAGETEYAFRHILVRDVAYGQIPRAERAEKHRRAAEWIESLGRPHEHAEMLAHHYLSALELATATGTETMHFLERARVASRDAGDRALALHAYPSAVAFYDAAIPLLPSDDPELPELLLSLARALTIAGDERAESALERARDELTAAGDNGRAAEAEMLLCDLVWRQGQRDLANEHLTRARSLIEGETRSHSTASVLTEMYRFLMLAGRPEEVLRLGREGLAIAEVLGLDELHAHALCWIGTARVLSSGEQAIEIATQANAPLALCRVYNNLSACLEILGEVESAYAARLEGARIAERLGAATWVRWFQGVVAELRYRRGDWDEALRMNDDFIASVEAGSPHYLEAQVRAVRAEMRLARGDSEGAMRDAESAVAAGRAAKDPQMLYTALAVGAHVFLLTGKDDEATTLTDEFLEALNRGLGLQWGVNSLPTFASAALRLGRGQELVDALANHLQVSWTEAARAYVSGDLARAAEICGEIGAKPQEAEARLRAAEALLEQGSRAEADAQLERALVFWRSVGATRYVQRGESLLATSVTRRASGKR